MKSAFFPYILAFGVANNVAHNIEHTVRIYQTKQSIFSIFEQNQFLSLQASPSTIKKGVDEVEILVPKAIQTYVWELSGFFQASSGNEYTFSIGETPFAIFELGSKEDHHHDFNDLFQGGYHIISKAPVPFFLEKKEYYPLKITYISGLQKVPIYVTKNGIKEELNEQIVHIIEEEDINGSEEILYFGSGFDFSVFLGSNDYDYQSMVEDRLDSYLLHQGSFDSFYMGINDSIFDADNITEVIGHFQVPLDGYYEISISKGSLACFQIGPGVMEKEKIYEIDSNWDILDTRSLDSDEFSFSANLFYPFRIVMVETIEETSWESRISVTNSSETEVCLFGCIDPGISEPVFLPLIEEETNSSMILENQQNLPEENTLGFKALKYWTKSTYLNSTDIKSTNINSTDINSTDSDSPKYNTTTFASKISDFISGDEWELETDKESESESESESDIEWERDPESGKINSIEYQTIYLQDESFKEIKKEDSMDSYEYEIEHSSSPMFMEKDNIEILTYNPSSNVKEKGMTCASGFILQVGNDRQFCVKKNSNHKESFEYVVNECVLEENHQCLKKVKVLKDHSGHTVISTKPHISKPGKGIESGSIKKFLGSSQKSENSPRKKTKTLYKVKSTNTPKGTKRKGNVSSNKGERKRFSSLVLFFSAAFLFIFFKYL